MKLNKFSKTAIVFTLGATVFTATAFADMMLGSGYDKFKQSIKNTTQNLENGFDSYTELAQVSITYNDQPIMNLNTEFKVDNVNKQQYEFSEQFDFLSEAEPYIYEDYRDRSVVLYKHGDGAFSGYRYQVPVDSFQTGRGYNEVFTNEYASEIETVVDAAVGNLKSIIQYEVSSEGNNKYTGELNSTQVPAVFNALLSLAFKESMQYEFKEYNQLPSEIKNVYISNVYGEAVEHEEGYLTSVSGHLELTFTDENNNRQVVTVNIALELVNINSTTVEKPVVDETTLEIVQDSYNKTLLPYKYVGTYKTDVIVETDEEFVKIGERIVNITEITDAKLHGTFEEIYNDHELAQGYTSYKTTFEDVVDDFDGFDGFVSYTNPVDGQIYYASLFDHGNGSIYFEFGYKLHEDGYMEHQKDVDYVHDGIFKRVFE